MDGTSGGRFRVRGIMEAAGCRKAQAARCRAGRRAARKAGKGAQDPGPPHSGFTLLPWLLLGMGSLSHLVQGETPNPWIGGLGILAFNSLYIHVVFRAFVKEKREARSTRVALVLAGLVTVALALGYGGSWLYFFPLLGLAVGAVARGPRLGRAGLALTVLAGLVSAYRAGWDAVSVAYGTFLSTMVTAAILSLSEAVRDLRAAREELARRAVEEERARFSRDLHDLLGHTLSVIVVKSEAARRLAPRDLEAALVQVGDIEAVGRQALTEIREAVTGYREGSLTAELDGARSALSAAGVEPVVRRSGPPLAPRTEALLGWVVREAVTNVVRHSGAAHCEITVSGEPERVRLTVTDDGPGRTAAGDAARATAVDDTASVTAVDDTASVTAGDDTARATAVDDTASVTAVGAAAVTDPASGTAGRTAAGLSRDGAGGTGLRGLTERLALAGGRLTAGPGPRGGFVVTAELPADTAESPLPPIPEGDPGTDREAAPGTAPEAGPQALPRTAKRQPA